MKDTIATYPLAGADVSQFVAAGFESTGAGVPGRLREILLSGEFFVFAPPGVSNDRLHRFDQSIMRTEETLRVGGYVLEKIRNLAECLAQVVCREFGDRALSVYIREPYLTGADKDAKIDQLTFVGGELFKVVNTEVTSEIELTTLIRQFTLTWSFLLVISSMKSNEATDIGDVISKALFIAVGCYDGESYLCWRRQESKGLAATFER